jgi:hypothetical protein
VGATFLVNDSRRSSPSPAQRIADLRDLMTPAANKTVPLKAVETIGRSVRNMLANIRNAGSYRLRLNPDQDEITHLL